MSTSARICLLVLLAMLVGGCGSGSNDSGGTSASDSPATKRLFVKTCGQCHTLADAGTTGKLGPQLDGMGLDAATVRAQIANGGGAMPPGLLDGADADAVAAYVSSHMG